jgi:hypothetical protein
MSDEWKRTAQAEHKRTRQQSSDPNSPQEPDAPREDASEAWKRTAELEHQQPDANAPTETPPPPQGAQTRGLTITDRTSADRKEHLRAASRVFTRAAAPLDTLRLGKPRGEDPPEQHAAQLAAAALFDAIALQDTGQVAGLELETAKQLRSVATDEQLRTALTILTAMRRDDAAQRAELAQLVAARGQPMAQA